MCTAIPGRQHFCGPLVSGPAHWGVRGLPCGYWACPGVSLQSSWDAAALKNYHLVIHPCVDDVVGLLGSICPEVTVWPFWVLSLLGGQLMALKGTWLILRTVCVRHHGTAQDCSV